MQIVYYLTLSLFKISRRMYITSWIFLISMCAGISYGCYLSAFAHFMLLICSLNYWRKPMRGLRRNIDIVNSVIQGSFGLIYYGIYTNPETMILYISTLAIGFLFFCISVMAQQNGWHDIDSFFHCNLHLLAGLSGVWIQQQTYLQNSL